MKQNNTIHTQEVKFFAWRAGFFGLIQKLGEKTLKNNKFYFRYMVKSCFRKSVLPLVCDYVDELRICSPMVRTVSVSFFFWGKWIYKWIFIWLWRQNGKKLYPTTSYVFFLFCIFKCLVQHGRNFLEYQRKVVGEFLGVFFFFCMHNQKEEFLSYIFPIWTQLLLWYSK